MAENWKHLYEQMKKMVAVYQDEIVPGLRKQVEELEAKIATDNNVGSKWISVKDRLPSLHDDVLMYFKDDDNMAVGYLDDVDEDRTMWSAYSDGGYYTDCDYEPTHWMPLPEAPKGE